MVIGPVKHIFIIAFLMMAIVNTSFAGGVAGFFGANEQNGNPNQSCPAAGTPNPINIASGNKFFKENIFKGRGEFPLIYNLYYNSRHYDAISNGSFIEGEWTYSYGQHLIIEPPSGNFGDFGDVEMRRPNGQSMFFKYSFKGDIYNGIIDSNPADTTVIVVNKELGELKHVLSTSGQVEKYVYTSLNGTQETYDSEGKLTEVKNLQGGGTHQVTYNLPISMSVQYIETGQLLSIGLTNRKRVDTVTDFVYSGTAWAENWDPVYTVLRHSEPSGITTPDGNQVTFIFDEISKDYPVASSSDCRSDDGVYHCVGDQNLFVSRLKDIIWSDDSKRTFEYSVGAFKTPVAANWIKESAISRVRSYNPVGQNIYTSSVEYASSGKAINSTVGSTNVAQSHYVEEVSPAHDWDVWNTHGRRTTFKYGRLNNRPILSSVEGEALSAGNCVRSNSTYTYDANGNRNLVTDTVTGLVTDYDYSLINNDLSNVGLLDKITYRNVDGGADREISYTWTDSILASTGQAFRQIESITKPGITKAITYEHGRVSTYTETDTTIDPPGYVRTHSKVRPWTYNYTYHGSDADGLHRIETLTVVNPRNATTTYTFDSIGNLVTIANDSDHTTTFSDHNARGLPRSLTTANNETSTLAYTAKGELESITTNNLSTSIVYDERGNIERFTMPDGSYLEYSYDDGGRLSNVNNHLGETLTVDHQRNSGVGEDMIVKTFTAGGVKSRHTETRFDVLGRFWKMYDLGGVSSAKVMQEIEYDSNNYPSGIVNGNGGRLTTVFDALGRLDTVDDLRDTPTTTASYQYNAQDLPTSVTDQEGLETTYHYDGFGLLLTMDSPNTGASQYFYDDAGNMTAKTDANLISTNYDYDLLNRLEGITYPTQAGVTLIYDQTITNGLANHGIGRLTTISKSNGDKIEWIYSKRGNVLYDIRTIAGQRYETQYEYNDGNNERAITAIHYPSGRIIDYIRTNGQVTRVEIRGAANSIASNIQYEPFGPMSSFQYGNGYTLGHNFDELTRVDTLNSSPYMNLDYQYDNNSNVDFIQDYYSSLRTQNLFYDPKSRLENSAGDYGTYNYLYDGVGNRTERGKLSGTGDVNAFTETYTYPSDASGLINQRLDDIAATGTGTENHAYTYNADGSMATDNNRTYTYDDSRRIVRIFETGSQIGTYSYNPLGQRDSKVAGGNSFHYVYGPSGELIYEINLSTGENRDYVFHEGRLIAFTEGATTSSAEDAWSAQYGNGQDAPIVTQVDDTLTINQSEVAGSDSYYVYGSLSSDSSISAKIPNFLGSTSGTEVGLEIRESSAANANFVRIDRFSKRPIVLLAFDIIIPIMLPQEDAIRVSYNNGGGTQVIDYAVGTYQYFKIEEVGGNVITYASTDGNTWTALGSPIALNITSSAVIGFRTQGLISSSTVSFQNVEQNGGVPSTSNTYYVHTDHLGTPQVITNATGGVVWSAVYKPFGGVARLTTALIENNVRFPGQYYDGETGLHYNYFRYYDPATGRYITSDPIGLAGGLNTYGYVGGNPVNLIDPYGLVEWIDLGFGIIDFGLSTIEAVTGLCGMAFSPATVAFAPTTFLGGLAFASHGITGMANSGIAIQNALNETANPGLYESVGGDLFGENGARLGQTADMYSGIRPGAIVSGSINSTRDAYDVVNAINTIDNAAGSNNSSQ